MIVAFIVICVALVIAALVKATNSSELLEIIGRLLPYLMALLTPILHYYFEHRQRHADDDKEV
ncbi:MAG: hypothetical protein BroJett011_07780 [Chloroflexota bacterium]|nr:MAG: hypothetical protein BroJett011_07780 [Chloroflexota bacterium]